MKKLGIDQRKAIGFQYIMDQVEPNTPYGLEVKKKLTPYSRTSKGQLEEELTLLNKISQGLRDSREARVHTYIEQMELAMMCMKEVRGSLKKAASQCLGDIEFFEVKNLLIQLEKLAPIYQDFCEYLELELPAIQETEGALNLLDPDKRRIPSFFLEDGYSPKLKEIRDKKRQLEVSLRLEQSPDLVREKKILRSQVVAAEEEEEQEIRRELTKKLRPYLEAVRANTELVGRLDFLLQKAKLVRKEGGIYPELTEKKLELEEMVNPELVHILSEKGKAFSPVTLCMSQGVTVITGANMGGKSVALRTAVLNIYLVHCGFFPFAKEAKVPFFDYLEMIAEEFQSMKDGLSSFGGEIAKLKTSLDQVQEGFGFLMLDELARGTNPDEGAEIVRGVVRYLQSQDVMALLATHYDHISEYAGSHYQVYGLKNKDMTSLQREIEMAGGSQGIDIIAKYMDYGIYQVTAQEDCPRDAIHVCQLLGLQDEVMKLIEEK